MSTDPVQVALDKLKADFNIDFAALQAAINPPPPPPPPVPPAAKFFWTNYSGSSPTDWSRYDLAVLQFGPAITAQIAAARAANPAIRVLMYRAPDVIDPNDPGGRTCALPCDPTKTNGGYDKSYFLQDNSGTVLRNARGQYFLAIGNAVVRSAVASRALEDCNTCEANGVFLDDLNSVLSLETLMPYASSPTPAVRSDTNWQTAYIGYLSVITGRLHNAGKIAVGNIAGGWVGNFWQNAHTLGGLDGAEEESVGDGRKGLLQQVPFIHEKLALWEWSEANRYMVLGHTYNGTEVGSAYSLALFLMGVSQQGYWDTANTDYEGNEDYYPSYDVLKTLGHPTGLSVMNSAGVLIRDFDSGKTLYVNPTSLTASIMSGPALPPTSYLIA